MPKSKTSTKKKYSKHNGHHNNTAINKTHIHIHLDKKTQRRKSKKPAKKRIRDLPITNYTTGGGIPPNPIPSITNKPAYDMRPFGQQLPVASSALVNQINRTPVFQSEQIISENAFTGQHPNVSKVLSQMPLATHTPTYFDLPENDEERSLMNGELGDVHFQDRIKRMAINKFKEQIPINENLFTTQTPTNGYEEEYYDIEDIYGIPDYEDKDYKFEMEKDLKSLKDKEKEKIYERKQNEINELNTKLKYQRKEIEEAEEKKVFDDKDFVVLKNQLKSKNNNLITPSDKKAFNSLLKNRGLNPKTSLKYVDKAIIELERIENQERQKFKDNQKVLQKKKKEDEFKSRVKGDKSAYREPPKNKARIIEVNKVSINGGGVTNKNSTI